MKNGTILSKISILAILLIMSGSTFAQRGQRGPRMQSERGRMAMTEGRHRIDAFLDLNEEQKEQIRKIRAEHQKDLRYQRNLLDEKNARLKTLLSAPERDKKEIEKTIDEISAMKGEIMKKQIANKEEFKNLLTPEQIQKLESFGHRDGMHRGAGFLFSLS